MRLAIAILTLVLAGSCSTRDRATKGSATAAGDATAPGAPPPPDTTVRPAGYRAVAIRDHKALERLRRDLGPERFLLVLKINRRDSLHVRDGDSLMVPVDSLVDLLALAPFPRELPDQDDRSKLLLVSRRIQAFAAYDSGSLTRWGPTSTGRESLQTPEGLYHTNWKDRERTSTFNEEWLLKWYINIENYLGISFHQFDLPGYPASHSCIRLLADDARWLYDWADGWKVDPKDRRAILHQGTPVVAFGRFAYSQTSPWRRLAVDSAATNVSWGEIQAALATYLPPARALAEPPPTSAP